MFKGELHFKRSVLSDYKKSFFDVNNKLKEGFSRKLFSEKSEKKFTKRKIFNQFLVHGSIKVEPYQKYLKYLAERANS
jgi:hypothetical protein